MSNLDAELQRRQVLATPEKCFGEVAGSREAGELQQQLAMLQRDLDRKFDVLKDYLSDQGVLSLSVYNRRLERQRFRELCQASNFKSEATFADILSKEGILDALGSFTGHNAHIFATRAACTDLGRSEKLLDVAALERLKGTFAADR
eukprot:UN05971